jgi:prefoldin subunit 5
MTGEEMERAIEFLLRNQATLEQRVEQTQAQLSELTRVVQMQAESQGRFNETITAAVASLAEAQTRTEAKVDRLVDVVGRLVERLAGGQG